jgi:hypothetical protein
LSYYKYPNEPTEDDIKSLSNPVKIAFKRQTSDFWSLVVLGLIVLIVLVPFTLYIATYVTSSNAVIVVGLLLFTSILASFSSTLIIERVRIIMRRFFCYFLHYPSAEDYIVLRCAIIAQRCVIDKRPYDNQWWYKYLGNKTHGATYQVSYLCEELSFFCKDWFNTRRGLYSPELSLLSIGREQIERALIFSNVDLPKLLLGFSLALKNYDDKVAYQKLKDILVEVEKYGKIESRLQKLTSQSNVWAVPFISALMTLIAGIIAIVLVLLGR